MSQLSRIAQRSLVGLNVLALSLVIFVLLRPGGALRGAIDEWQAARALRHSLAEIWPTMVGRSARLDEGAGPVLLAEFSDYQCPYCKAMEPTVEAVIAQQDNAGIVHIQFPLPSHAHAAGAARASICAEGQGRFRAMHRRLFETSRWQEDESWVREAVAAGVADTLAFTFCLKSEATTSRLNDDIELGKRLGVAGTPTFVTRDASESGVRSREELSRMLGGGTR